MPSAPRRPCPHPGCPELTDGGPCPAHRRAQQRQQDLRRGSFRERGYSSEWDKARRVYLAHHPLCVECEREGRYVSANVVDHIEPHRGDKRKFWDVSNWQSLCIHHHAMKTAREDGGFGNANG